MELSDETYVLMRYCISETINKCYKKNLIIYIWLGILSVAVGVILIMLFKMLNSKQKLKDKLKQKTQSIKQIEGNIDQYNKLLQNNVNFQKSDYYSHLMYPYEQKINYHH